MYFISFLGAFLLLFPNSSVAQESNALPAVSATVITNVAQFWALSSEEKKLLHHARLKLLIYYCDPNWNVYWGRSDGLDTFLPLRDFPKQIEAGEKVVIDGPVYPIKQEFLWDKTSINMVSKVNHLPCIAAGDEFWEKSNLDSHFVEVKALVDSQILTAPNVWKLGLFADNHQFGAYVHVEAGNEIKTNLLGKIVRIKGVYSQSSDAFGGVLNVTLWTPSFDYVNVVGLLKTDPRFSIPISSSDKFVGLDPHKMIRVRGIVRGQQPGQGVTIWDDTGQIRILTKQLYPLKLGESIEAIGYPAFEGLDRILKDGIFRVVSNASVSEAELMTNGARLYLADQVRGLDEENVAKHLRVSIEGVVTWADPRRKSIFVSDSSGGIQVMHPRYANGNRIRSGMLVKVDGVAGSGQFAPVIIKAIVHQTGIMNLPDAPQISYEQALTGAKDGCWVQMRSYVRDEDVETNGIQLHLVAPGGEFVARVPRVNSLKYLQGSVVLVSGVCVVTANSRHQLTGIEIWSPSESNVQVEQSAPENVFALPKRSIASLRRFNLFNTLNEQVHTYGTVTLQVPGRCLYLQDGDYSVLVLSDQTEPLQPGDRVEVVGFSGHENGSFVLREAVYRRISSGSDLVPMQLSASHYLNDDADGLLVRAEGTLIDVVRRQSETDLTLQAKGLVFEARLDRVGGLSAEKLDLGSKLAVAGVYRLQPDEYGRPRSFLLNLRDPNDISVLQPPPWWTLGRLLWALAGTLFVFLLALAWALEIRHRNSLLLKAQAELQTAHGKLEERVQERTRELSEQVEEKKRAHARLSEAQQRLMIASRQAGMAEVATGILHNVGNVLNSVNVSASLVGDSLKRFHIENFSKAAALLNEQNGHLVEFLTEDPRGRALPGYLRDLANAMAENQCNLRDEIGSLIKQIDHIKTIVVLQQNYARNSSLTEYLDPVEVMEDAVHINLAGYERHEINLVRQYENPPRILADQHKILQILINLLSNAKYALESSSPGDKRVVLRIHGEGSDRMRFEVSDTGVGIAPENLERIFTLGFTTRPNGHGFGLHSGANAAKEMGGRLYAVSEGLGRGATLVLELPIVPKSREPEAEQTMVSI